jgi:hypothetical protein
MYVRKYVALGLAILFALSVLLLILRLARPATTAKAPFSFKVSCPDCGKPLPGEGAKCTYCAYLRRTREMTGIGGGPQPHELSPVGKLAIVAGILGLLTGLAFYPELRRFRQQWARANEESWVVRCKKCKRKLRYPASNAGKQGACPGCRATMIFPAEDGKPMPASEPAPSA